MKVVVLHPTGNKNVRAILQSLIDHNALAEFETTIAVNKNAGWLKYLPQKIQKEALRRSYEVSPGQLWTHGFLELSRMLISNIKLDKYFAQEKSFASTYSVYKEIDKAASKRLVKLNKEIKLNAVYAYEDGALAMFEQAKSLGLKCIYDLPIAYWETGRKLMQQEAERLPNWAGTLGGGILDSEEKLQRKTREMELADVIVGPGDFVMYSIPAWAQSKVKIMAPFGSPVTNTTDIVIKDTNRPLRVLFAGSMGQRKGLGDLFAAINILKGRNVELIVMGSLLESMAFYRNELKNFIFEPSRPHHEVLALMRSCDVFCLPSIVEGRALVMQEAMSQGLPLIITQNRGGADLIIEGKTGFLVPIRSPESIAEKISWFLDNRNSIAEMGEYAKEHSAKYSWEIYGSTVVKSIEQYLLNE